MKSWRILFAALLLSTPAFAQDTNVRATVPNSNIGFYTSPSGTLTKRGEVNSNGQLRFDSITNLAGSGSPSFPNGVSLDGNLVFTPTAMSVLANTADASDTKSILLGGGGGTASTRGATVQAFGNEATTFGGRVYVAAGSPATASAANPALVFQTAPTTAAALVDSLVISGAGALSIGQAVTGNVNGQRHTMNGSLYAGNVTSTAQSGFMNIGVNTYGGSSTANVGRTNTTTGGATIAFSNDTSATGQAFQVYTNKPGDGLTTAGVVTLLGDYNGKWVIGPSGYSGEDGAEHVVSGAIRFNGNAFIGTSAGDYPTIGYNLRSSSSGFKCAFGGDRSFRIRLGGSSGNAFSFYTTTANCAGAGTLLSENTIATSTDAGAWTFGLPAATTSNRSNGPMEERAQDTDVTNVAYKKSRVVRVATSGSSFGIASADVSRTQSSIVCTSDVLMNQFDQNAKALYRCYAEAHNQGPTFTAVGCDLVKNIVGTMTAPSISWSGSGSARNLNITVNASTTVARSDTVCLAMDGTSNGAGGISLN